MTVYNCNQNRSLQDRTTGAFLLFFNSPRGKFKLSDEAQNNYEKVVILGDSLAMQQFRQKWAIPLQPNKYCYTIISN